MGDLRLMNFSSCSPSGLLPPFSAAYHKVCELSLFSRELQQPGTSRIGSEPCRRLCSSSQAQRKFQLRAIFNDQQLPSSFHSGEDGPHFKEDADLGIFDRLALAWRVLFPKRKKLVTPAEIAKQRLKMILISDRCLVNDSAKRKIVNNIVGALADFVEIESQDRVRLNVSADPDLGTVYSVSVPVRRVKQEYQDNGNDVKGDLFQESLMLESVELPAGDVEHSETFVEGSLNEEACKSSTGVKDTEG